MEVKALLQRKDPEITAYDHAVDDVIEISGEEYASLYQDLLSDRSYFAGREGNCYLVLGEGERDGILVELEGYKYARYSAFIPYARTIVSDHIRELADHAVNEGVRREENCNAEILFEELQEQYGTKLTRENGFGKLLAEELQKRKGIASVTVSDEGIGITYTPKFLQRYKTAEKEKEETESLESLTDRYPSLEKYAREMARLADRYTEQALETELNGECRIRFQDVEKSARGIRTDRSLFTEMLSERDEIAWIRREDEGCSVTVAEPYIGKELPHRELSEADVEIMCAKHVLWLNDIGGERADFTGCLIKDVALQNKNLLSAIFGGAKLVNVNMRNTSLCFSDFKGARFYGCDLSGAIAEECEFSGARLSGTKLDGAIFSHSNFTGVKAYDCSAAGASLNRCCMENADLGNIDRRDLRMNGTSDNEEEWLAQADCIKAEI